MKSKPHPLAGKILGAYQLLVGGYGALFFTVQIIKAGGAGLAGLVFAGMYALVAYAGFALLKNRPGGVSLTVLAQALQVVRISSSSFAYTFVAGLAFWLELNWIGVQVSGLDFGAFFRWMTAFGFGPGTATQSFSIGVNLVAAAILVYLFYGRSKSGKTRK